MKNSTMEIICHNNELNQRFFNHSRCFLLVPKNIAQFVDFTNEGFNPYLSKKISNQHQPLRLVLIG